MSQAFADPASIEGYHAHIYYDVETRPVAERLREAIGAGFQAQLGRWHDNPVGPHPISMYQVAFPVAEFPRLVPWLMLNRAGLTVLVHPLTGDDYEDHATFPLWLGTALPLKLEILKRRGRGRVSAAVGPLSADEVAAYRRDGYLVVRGLIGPRLVEACRQALSDLAADRVPKGETKIWLESGFAFDDIPPESREPYVRKYMDYVEDAPALKAAAMNRRLHLMLDQLLGQGRVLFQEMALVKPPRIGSDKPWHQDASYFRLIDPSLIAGVWIALDQATRNNGCMEVVPGSHRGGPRPHVHENDLARCAMPDDKVSRNEARALEMEPGDALVFHALVHHFTGPNRSNGHRRAIQFHYHQIGAVWGSLEDHRRLYHHDDGSYAGCTTLHGDADAAAYAYRGPLTREIVPMDEPA